MTRHITNVLLIRLSRFHSSPPSMVPPSWAGGFYNLSENVADHCPHYPYWPRARCQQRRPWEWVSHSHLDLERAVNSVIRLCWEGGLTTRGRASSITHLFHIMTANTPLSASSSEVGVPLPLPLTSWTWWSVM
jgi:hypothetical protein